MSVKNAFKKENLMPVVVLTVICLIVAALLGAVNMITAPIIEERTNKAISESLSSVMPNGDFTTVEVDENTAPETVTAIYKDNNSGGHVVTLEKQGFASVIYLTVGIDAEQKITNVVITSEGETHSKKGEIPAFLESFIGTANSPTVDHVSGATYTSGYIKDAIYDAYVVLGYASPKGAEDPFDYAGVTDTTDDEAIAIAKELMPGSYEKASTEGMPTTVRAVYRNTSGGYAIHIATRTVYRDIECEGIVTVDKTGSITGIRMLEWVVGYDSNLLDKAPECDKEFLDSFIGKNSSSLARVELVTHATNTSNNFTNALTSALDVLYPTKLYSTVCAVLLAAVLVGIVGSVVYIKVKRRKNG